MDDLTPFERQFAAALDRYAPPGRRIDSVAIAHRAAGQGSLRRQPLLGSFEFAAVAFALVLLVGVALALYSNRSSLLPATSPSPEPTTTATNPVVVASPTPVESPAPGAESTPSPTPPPNDSVQPTDALAPRLVAYTVEKELRIDANSSSVYQRIWVANDDGSDARELLADPSAVGGEPADQQIVGWLPDGSGLLYTEGWSEGTVELFMTDASGSEPRLICRASDCPGAPPERGPVDSDISPDGRRLAFASPQGIAILDLASGQVDRLDIPPAGGLEPCVPAARAYWSGPVWSPDGTQLLLSSGFWSLQTDFCRNVVLAVNADGSNLRMLISEDVHAGSASWSPDGSRILYAATSPEGGHGNLFTMRSDATDVRQVAEYSSDPHWTADGRIQFTRWVASTGRLESPEVWLANADGTGQLNLSNSSLAELTAIGCSPVCPLLVPTGFPDESQTRDVYWQPVPGRDR